MKVRLLFLFLSLGIQRTQAQQDQSLNLEQCITYALTHNIGIQQSQLSTAIIDQDIRTNKLERLPSVNGQVGYNNYWGRSIDPTTYQFITQSNRSGQLGLNANLPLYNGGRNKLTAQQLALDKAAADYDILSMQNDLSMQVAAAYLQVLLSKEQVLVAKQYNELTSQQYTLQEKSFKAGALAESALADANAQLVNTANTLANAKNAATMAENQLKVIMNFPLESSLVIVKPKEIDQIEPTTILPSLQGLWQESSATMPQILAADTRIASAQKGTSIAKTFALPSFNLNGGLNTNFSSAAQRIKNVSYSNEVLGYVLDTIPITASQPKFEYEKTPLLTQWDQNFAQYVGLNLQIPIFNSGQVKSNINKANINTQIQQLRKENLLLTLKQQISTALSDAQMAQLKWVSAQEKQKANEKAFGYIETKRKVGMSSALEYNTAQNNALQSANETLQAKYEYIFKLKILDFYAGKSLQF